MFPHPEASALVYQLLGPRFFAPIQRSHAETQSRGAGVEEEVAESEDVLADPSAQIRFGVGCEAIRVSVDIFNVTGPDYIVDLSTRPDPTPASTRTSPAGRPWIAVRWRCCSTYSRIYRHRDATAYEGRCPRCGKSVRARVGEGGTDQRFFEAG